MRHNIAPYILVIGNLIYVICVFDVAKLLNVLSGTYNFFSFSFFFNSVLNCQPILRKFKDLGWPYKKSTVQIIIILYIVQQL